MKQLSAVCGYVSVPTRSACDITAPSTKINMAAVHLCMSTYWQIKQTTYIVPWRGVRPNYTVVPNIQGEVRETACRIEAKCPILHILSTEPVPCTHTTRACARWLGMWHTGRPEKHGKHCHWASLPSWSSNPIVTNRQNMERNNISCTSHKKSTHHRRNKRQVTCSSAAGPCLMWTTQKTWEPEAAIRCTNKIWVAKFKSLYSFHCSLLYIRARMSTYMYSNASSTIAGECSSPSELIHVVWKPWGNYQKGHCHIHLENHRHVLIIMLFLWSKAVDAKRVRVHWRPAQGQIVAGRVPTSPLTGRQGGHPCRQVRYLSRQN